MATTTNRTLALYHYNGCPYCGWVRDTLSDLGVEAELRNIHQDPQHRRDLMQALGRGTVPVLRIVEDGRDEWMPESRDIMHWLRQEYGSK